jgi:isopentenyl-diphosphate Delta-isomerase
MDHVILVDENDSAIGTMEKLEAHKKGVLHRAFSALIFNSKGEILLQQRSSAKYHSGGLWTNTCCSHPLPDEDTHTAVRRRLLQEMGIDVNVDFSHKFIYRTRLDHDLIEHEYDHVFVGRFDGEPVINPEEVAAWRFASPDDVKREMTENPEAFTYWFKLIINQPEMNPVQKI